MRGIKLILFSCLMFLFVSCSLENESNINNFYFEYVPFESVELPSEFQLGETYVIEYTYYRPTTCHGFNDLFYDSDMNVQTIAIINTVVTNGPGTCFDLADELVVREFRFVPNTAGQNLFKFWKGTDDNGEDIYLEMEVQVNE